MEEQSEPTNESRLLMPGEVAKTFRVSTKTVARWARSGKITCVRTIGGHRRFYADEIERLLADSATHRKED